MDLRAVKALMQPSGPSMLGQIFMLGCLAPLPQARNKDQLELLTASFMAFNVLTSPVPCRGSASYHLFFFFFFFF